MFVGGQRRERANTRPPNIVAVALLVLPIIAGLAVTIPTQNPLPVIAGVLIGIVLVQSP
jgi:hypothetical protein